MTDWNALRDSAKEPDTLEKVIADIEGALLPMMKLMPKQPTEAQWRFILEELSKLSNRADKEWFRLNCMREGNMAQFEWLYGEPPGEVQNGDDANTDP